MAPMLAKEQPNAMRTERLQLAWREALGTRGRLCHRRRACRTGGTLVVRTWMCGRSGTAPRDLHSQPGY